ncbi:MAG TPA: nuclear transport factor 2 family protein [Solirubrobacterales bacterium]|jgi:ketosteroid isomerase-like protein
MRGTNAELARRGFEAASHGDLEVIAELLDDGVKWHGGDPSGPGSCSNKGQALEFMRQAIARGGVGELVEIVEAGDRVVVVLRPAGSGEEGETTANLTTFRDGKAVEMIHYPSVRDALAAVGR